MAEAKLSSPRSKRLYLKGPERSIDVRAQLRALKCLLSFEEQETMLFHILDAAWSDGFHAALNRDENGNFSPYDREPADG